MYNTPVQLKDISVTDTFWKQEMELVRQEVIPYQWDALNDRIQDAAPSFCMRNFKIAANITKKRKEQGAKYQEVTWPLTTFQTLPEDMEHLEQRFYGYLFQDSDFAKWIEAVGYSLTQHPDRELEKIADDAIDLVCKAQQENGYLDTYYIINDMSKVFTNLKDNHELYCFGHLVEGAIAYYEATGKDQLLHAAMKYADYIATCFGPEEDKKQGYPGHEIAEMALVRLYEVTKEEKYLNLASFFIDERGKRPYYFDKEHPEAIKKGEEEKLRYEYQQAHLPVREQKEAVGHAVRAVYLYSGMADVARITKEEALKNACERLWNNIVDKKLYITGGIGATHLGEAFSYNYDLPNDMAYAETCASIGLVFFARRMLQLEVDSKYSDVMERVLYNGVLSGIALDGKSFFYVNPLEVNPEACHKDQRKGHVKPVRQKWFGCACCPPNIARLLSSIASYAYTESDDTLYIHQYVGGTIKKNFHGIEAEFHIQSDLPWQGTVKIIMQSETPVMGTIAIRVPGWCSDYMVNESRGIYQGETMYGDVIAKIEKGYLYLTKKWEMNDVIDLTFTMEAVLLESNELVTENTYKVAVARGPMIYCMEEADNGANLQYLAINPPMEYTLTSEQIAGHDMVALNVEGKRRVCHKEVEHSLYRTYVKPDYEKATIKMIPYYSWANRGEGKMKVWIDLARN